MTRDRGAGDDDNETSPEDERESEKISPSDTVSVEDSLHVRVRRGADQSVVAEQNLGFGGRNSSVDFDNSGIVRIEASGKPRPGDTGAKEVVQRLVAHLASQEKLAEPVALVVDREDDPAIDEPVDCEVRGQGGAVLLRTQLVSAGLYFAKRSLGQSGVFSDGTTVESLADLLMEAIKKKGAHYPAAAKKGIWLVLEAIDHQFALATEPVVAAFRSLHQETARNAGFDAVWLVGPVEVVQLA